MSTSTHDSRSPPRRARPSSGIPAPFLSANFSAASHALQLIEDPETDVHTTLSSLRALRDRVSASLHSTAPSWSAFTPALASLQDALRATQTSSHLRQTLTTMQHDISALDDYPARMASVVHRASQLSANVALASAVRDFAHLLRAAEIPESLILPSQQSANDNPIYPSASPPKSASPQAPVLPERFLQRAAALRRAKIAASSPPLVHVSALNDTRATLSRYHASLQTELETALVNAIFASVESSTSNQKDEDDGHHTFAPATTLKTSTPNATNLPQTIFPSLIQAVDLLGGRNHAATVLRDAAPAKMVSLVCEALLADPARPPSTIASSPMSAFMTALPFSSRLSQNNPRSLFSPDSPVRLAFIFDEQLTPSNRLFCAVVFERVRSSMTTVLRRLSTLAEAVDSEDSRIFDVLNHVWRSMEAALVSFLQALLAFPTTKPPPLFKSSDERQSIRISLLPEKSRKSSCLNTDVPHVAWELDDAQSPFDSFKAFMNNVKPLVPSIYNLEVIYAQLQQFISMSSRLKFSWRDRIGTQSPDSTRASPALSKLLVRAVDLFICDVRRDVREQMKSILGSRSGSLLQPLSHRDDHPSKSSPGKSTFAKETGREDDTTGPTFLPQTQMLINVIASCLSLAVAVPSVAANIGEIINHEVLMPFCQRASHALELVAGWSDGGILYNEMWNTIARRESVSQAGGSETSEDKVMGFSAKARKLSRVVTHHDVSRGRILHTIRNESGISTKVLGQLCNRNRQYIYQTRTLLRNEWDAVLRLVANVKLVVSELESCFVKRDGGKMGGAVLPPGEPLSKVDELKFTRLRDLLQIRGVGSNMYGPVVEAVEQTQISCGMLREEVIGRGLILLHCEVILHCFCSTVKALRLDGVSIDEHERPHTVSNQKSTFYDDEGRTGDQWTMNGSESRKVDGDMLGRTHKENGLSRPSSIFKALPIQLSDVERTSDEESWGMNEFDEFGDRITVTNENVNETDIEEYMFPNSLLLEHNDWKVADEEVEKGVRDNGALKAKAEETVTTSDRRALETGSAFGEELKRMDRCVEQNLGSQDRDYVVREADEGVALGIRFSGEMRSKGDRDVATGARLLMDAAAAAAADTLGWPVVESDYSVAEGASHSASECRTLLFAAGML